ncbi:DUF6461 domain-containing protein [Kitasatospora sp. NPDC051853]|uniref:DUF6461 domain-containing protein n=1 Tax=Kitasatospora sp. NPDC051853 TaxID=3364058 RepID=UPI0037B7B174
MGIRWFNDEQMQWLSGLLLAKGVGPQELAARLGADPGAGLIDRPLTHGQASEMMPGSGRSPECDGMVRVGAHSEWSFALEYGAVRAQERLAEISQGGAEVFHYQPSPEHPPTQVAYAADGRVLVGFGLLEENLRGGEQPDLLLADLIAAGVLTPDGRPHPGTDYRARKDRSLGVLERRFGLGLPQEVIGDLPLTAYAVRGVQPLATRREVIAQMSTWAADHGITFDPHTERVPIVLLEMHAQATGHPIRLPDQ